MAQAQKNGSSGQKTAFLETGHQRSRSAANFLETPLLTFSAICLKTLIQRTRAGFDFDKFTAFSRLVWKTYGELRLQVKGCDGRIRRRWRSIRFAW